MTSARDLRNSLASGVVHRAAKRQRALSEGSEAIEETPSTATDGDNLIWASDSRACTDVRGLAAKKIRDTPEKIGDPDRLHYIAVAAALNRFLLVLRLGERGHRHDWN